MKKENKDGRNIAGLLIILAGLLIVWAVLTNPFWESPETKAPVSVVTNVMDTVLEQQKMIQYTRASLQKLKKCGIDVCVGGYIAEVKTWKFLSALLEDKETQKIFRKFTKASIRIHIVDEYKISNGAIWIDGRDTPQKVAEWLSR